MGERDTVAIDTLVAMNMTNEVRNARADRLELAPSGRPYGDEIMMVAFRRDPASMEELLAGMQSPALQAPTRVALIEGDFSFAERLARTALESGRTASMQRTGYINLARLFVAQGRWSEAAIELGNARSLDPDQTVLVQALLASLPWVAVPRDEVSASRDALLGWTPTPAVPDAPLERSYVPHQRLYVLGLLASRLGEFEKALSYADSIERLPDPAETAVPLEYTATLRANVARDRGSSAADVLTQLDPVRGRVPAAVYALPMFSQERARFLRAEALHGVGRDDEALRWLNNSFTLPRAGVYYKAPVLYLTARIHDANSRPDEARNAREAFERIWSGADAEIVFPSN